MNLLVSSMFPFLAFGIGQGTIVTSLAFISSLPYRVSERLLLFKLKFKKDFAIFWKIGITNRTVEKRFGGESMFIVERNIWEYENGGDAYSIEQKVLAAFAKYRIEMPLFTLLGNGGDTECFVPSLPVQKVVNFIKKAYN